MKPKNERCRAHTCSEKKFMNPHVHTKKKFMYPHTEIKLHVPAHTDKKNSSTCTHIGRILEKPVKFTSKFRKIMLLLVGRGHEVHKSCYYRIWFITFVVSLQNSSLLAKLLYTVLFVCPLKAEASKAIRGEQEMKQLKWKET